jgi:hypothetical protein
MTKAFGAEVEKPLAGFKARLADSSNALVDFEMA